MGLDSNVEGISNNLGQNVAYVPCLTLFQLGTCQYSQPEIRWLLSLGYDVVMAAPTPPVGQGQGPQALECEPFCFGMPPSP